MQIINQEQKKFNNDWSFFMGYVGKQIWKWIKRVLFILVMSVSLLFAVGSLEFVSGGVNIFLGILTIVLPIGSCVLYFIFNEYKKWPIVLNLLALSGVSFYLAATIEANFYGICLMCSLIGFIIPFMESKEKKKERKQKEEEKKAKEPPTIGELVIGILFEVASVSGFIAGIAVGIYKLFFDK